MVANRLQALIVALLLSSCLAVERPFSYLSQDEWPGVCVRGNHMRQSPINIITQDVQVDESLRGLQMAGWDLGNDGTFTNMGSNVQFNPSTPRQASTRNHLGIFEVLQFHFHWGRRSGEGSEHLIDMDASELEIHFVHVNRDEDNETATDYLSVISVLADVDDNAPITGPWAMLNASRVNAVNSSINVIGFRFDQLLPSDLDFFCYEGSLTTPPCSEVVAWFVLKSRITVPGAYLEQLRTLQGNTGGLQSFNFRMPQVLGGRIVRTNSQAGATVEPLHTAIMILCLMFVTVNYYYCSY